MTPPTVDVTITDGAALVVLNDAARRNAIGSSLAAALVDACDRIDADESVGVAILSGAGGYFCAGGDRHELARISADPYTDAARAALDAIYSAFIRISTLKVPSIAAIEGGAVGAGLNLVLATDVRIIARDAVLAAGFPGLGVHPGGGHLGQLARISPQAAVALGVLDDRVDGVRAVEAGVCWRCVERGETLASARQLAGTAAKDPQLSRAIKATARAEVGPPAVSWTVGLELERGPQLWSFARKGAAGWRSRQNSEERKS